MSNAKISEFRIHVGGLGGFYYFIVFFNLELIKKNKKIKEQKKFK